MEENQNRNPKKKRSLLSSTSIMMSFILAFVAIVSIAAFGFSQVSYAIPAEVETEFPNNITTISEDSAHTVKGIATGSPLIALHRATINGNTKYVYCIESDVDIESNVSYVKGNKITDKGLLFLLNYLASDTYTMIDGSGNTVTEIPRGWIVQTALWVYLHETGYANNTGLVNGTPYFDDAAVTLVRNETALMAQDDALSTIFSQTGGIYANVKLKDTGLSAADSTINGLIAKAKRIKAGTEDWNNFTLNVSKKSDSISITDDGDYYQSDIVTVNGSSGIQGYEIKTTGLPVGTKFYSTDGTELTDVTNLTNGTQFVVRIPKNSITNDNKNVAISITGAFTGKTAYYYTYHNDTHNVDRQKIAYVGEVTQHINQGVVIPFDYTPVTEDTGITAAQSVYFIGLIILLAGVGIIYANIKPNKVSE